MFHKFRYKFKTKQMNKHRRGKESEAYMGVTCSLIPQIFPTLLVCENFCLKEINSSLG